MLLFFFSSPLILKYHRRNNAISSSSNKHFLSSKFVLRCVAVVNLTLAVWGQPPYASFLSSFVRSFLRSRHRVVPLSVCLPATLFRQNYLSFDRALHRQSCTRDGEKRERERARSRLPCTFSDALARSRKRTTNERWYEGSSSVQNIIHCAGAIVFTSACVSKRNGTLRRGIPSPTCLPTSLLRCSTVV